MIRHFLICLSFINSFLLVIPIQAKPITRNEILMMLKNRKASADAENNSRLPIINVNIFVMPIVRDIPADNDELRDYNKLVFSPRERMESTTTTTTHRPEPWEELEAMASSNEVNEIDFADRLDPALGIISPQQERPMCKHSEVYDKKLGQCIKLNPGPCPLCRRKING